LAYEFTVCICTRNRVEMLLRAMDGVFRQTLTPAEYEVLVVDNASSDRTTRAALEFQRPGRNLRVVQEPVIGLSAARNRAAAEAAGEWLAYLDDDALPPLDWLEQARNIVRAQAPDLLGGPFYPFYTTPKPAWFKDRYGSGEFGMMPRWLNPDEYLFGGNLFIRRDMLLEAGGFPLNLGPQGEQLFYGDETGLQRLLRRSNPVLRVYYAPQLAIRHWVAPFKMSLFGRAKQRWAEGKSGYLAFRQPGERDRVRPIHLVGFLVMPAVLLWRVTLGVLLRDRKQHPAWQNYIYETAMDGVAVWGKLYQRLATNWGRERADA
jgi:glycosyltransferase involved in cell wall biosynthesis